MLRQEACAHTTSVWQEACAHTTSVWREPRAHETSPVWREPRAGTHYLLSLSPITVFPVDRCARNACTPQRVVYSQSKGPAWKTPSSALVGNRVVVPPAAGLGPRSGSVPDFPTSPFQPVPEPVVREQRHRHARRPDGGDVQRAGSPVLPGFIRTRCASHPPGAGFPLLGIPAVRRGPRGHRPSRQPVRRLGPSPPHSLVDPRVPTFHVNGGLRHRHFAVVVTSVDLIDLPGTTVAAPGSREGNRACHPALKGRDTCPAVLGGAEPAVRTCSEFCSGRVGQIYHGSQPAAFAGVRSTCPART